MRRLSLTLLATAAIGLVATVASAADLPRKAPAYQPPPPPPPYNWTGLYLGGHFGAGWSRNEFGSDNFIDVFGSESNLSHNGVGVLGGFQLGYNWQAPGSQIVWGIDGTFSFADIKGNASNSVSGINTGPCDFGEDTCIDQFNANVGVHSKVRDLATLAARFGLASGPLDRTLWYVKGGAAWARTNYTANVTGSFSHSTFDGETGGFEPEESSTGNFFGSATGNKTSRWGWMVGTGVEWALFDNWSTFIEYNYLNFGHQNFQLTDNAGDTAQFSVKQQIHALKVGLNYRFDWGRAGKAPY